MPLSKPLRKIFEPVKPTRAQHKHSLLITFAAHLNNATFLNSFKR